MRMLVWQWGRRGAGPRVAVELARSFAALPGQEVTLSLSTDSEIMRSATPPVCDLPVDTYKGLAGFIGRLASWPLTVRTLTRALRRLQPDVAICAMPGPLDLLMVAALRRVGAKVVVVVHDADAHPGDGLPFQMMLQRRLTREADGLVALTRHVAARLIEQGLAGSPRSTKPLFMASLPPLVFGPMPPRPREHGGRFRLLSFGRLLPYKGLDLLAEALRLLGPRPDLEVRIVGSGPDSEVLSELQSMPDVTVENRWVPEDEIGALLAWSDGLILSHREASQSGVAAAAVAARRLLIATRVGGLVEQLQNEPLAILCEPSAASLADGLRRVLSDASAAGVPAEPPPLDPRGGWQEVASRLVAEIDASLMTRRSA